MRTIAFVAVGLMLTQAVTTDACTGITLTGGDGRPVVARTIEWGGSDLKSCYVIVPRGFVRKAFLPGGEQNGAELPSRYGYVGLSVEREEFVAEGLNEAGLSVGLFYFPGYGRYEDYRKEHAGTTVGDLQLVPWMLGGFSTVDEVIDAVSRIHVVSIDPRASTAHWRIADASGRQVVLEIVDGKVRFHENKLGVLTNSPGFEWHITNLNNYVNLRPGPSPDSSVGAVRLSAFGAGSGFLGLPGDVTPPSRFVRAAFYQSSAPVRATAEETVMQCFQILNNFDIPIGTEFAGDRVPADIPSATQWTSATDIAGRRLYYRTMRNSAVRCFDLSAIRFDRVKYQTAPLDEVRTQPVTTIKIR